MATTAEPRHAGQQRSRGHRIVDAVDTRLGLDALRYPVPEHANNLAWSLGGLAAACLGVLLVTGVLLAQFYNPVPEVANASVRSIVNDVVLGRFVRALHFWSAQAMYVLALLHLIRVFFHGSYKRPREANWLIGVGMLGLSLLGIFTGTVLKWDQEGYEALAHNLEVAELLGGAGFWFSPAFAEHTPVLVRLYAAHVMLIPGLLLVLLTVHALLIKRHRISAHPGLPSQVPDTPAALDAHLDSAASSSGDAGLRPGPADGAHARVATGPGETIAERSEPFTHHLRRLGAFALVLLGGLTALSVLLPPPVGPTPVAGIEVTRPPWPFWWMFTLENWMGLPGMVWGGTALFLLLILVPFVDRNPARSWRARPVAMLAGAAVLTVLVVLTALVLLTSPAEHLGM